MNNLSTTFSHYSCFLWFFTNFIPVICAYFISVFSNLFSNCSTIWSYISFCYIRILCAKQNLLNNSVFPSFPPFCFWYIPHKKQESESFIKNSFYYNLTDKMLSIAMKLQVFPVFWKIQKTACLWFTYPSKAGCIPASCSTTLFFYCIRGRFHR